MLDTIIKMSGSRLHVTEVKAGCSQRVGFLAIKISGKETKPKAIRSLSLMLGVQHVL